jgi:lysophospholipase L1-like esterase
MPLRISSNSKLLMIGDSITDCGRAQPVGEGLFDALGKGYVACVDAHRTVFVDSQAAFDRVLAVGHSARLAWDRVHPNATGHMVLARAFLDGIGFDWGKAA